MSCSACRGFADAGGCAYCSGPGACDDPHDDPHDDAGDVPDWTNCQDCDGGDVFVDDITTEICRTCGGTGLVLE